MIINLNQLYADAPPPLRYKLGLLKFFILEPVEERFGDIQVTSGYRTPAKQATMDPSRAAKGTSQHTLAEAADIITLKAKYEDVYKFIHDKLRWWQLMIYYTRGAANEIHVSIPSEIETIKQKALVNVDGVWLVYDGTLPPTQVRV